MSISDKSRWFNSGVNEADATGIICERHCEITARFFSCFKERKFDMNDSPLSRRPFDFDNPR